MRRLGKEGVEQVQTLNAFLGRLSLCLFTSRRYPFSLFRGYRFVTASPFGLLPIGMRKENTMFTFDDLLDVTRRPEPYEPGEELWNDPHISKMMLEAHLSPETDAASYRPEKIHAICEYLVRGDGPGKRVVRL